MDNIKEDDMICKDRKWDVIHKRDWDEIIDDWRVYKEDSMTYREL